MIRKQIYLTLREDPNRYYLSAPGKTWSNDDEGHSTVSRALELEPQHQIQDTSFWEVCREYCRPILSPIDRDMIWFGWKIELFPPINAVQGF